MSLRSSGGRVDAVVFTSLSVETRAVLSFLSPAEEWVSPANGTIADVAVLVAPTGPVRVAVVQVEPTATAAAGILQEILDHLHPSYALFVGLARGLGEICAGSVVAATKVYAFDRGEDAKSFLPHPELGASSYRMVARATAEARRSGWMVRLFGDDLPDERPAVHVAPIAAGAPLVRSTAGMVHEFLKRHYSDAVAVETAGYGFLQTAYQNKLDAIVIRGIHRRIDDEAPEHTRPSDEDCARHAAAFAFELLSRVCGSEKARADAERAREPVYETNEQRRIAQELNRLRAERESLLVARKDTSKIDEKVRDLRRRQRTGPELSGGTLLSDRYLLIERLGQGGFGTVWEGWDKTDERHVAIKVLDGKRARDESTREQFYRGARTMDRLRHDGIVGVIDERGSDDGYHYFVMELYRARLRDAVTGGNLTSKERATIVLEVADALAYAHGKGVIHRDVKPDNILLDVNLRAKLTDFDLVLVEGTFGASGTGAMGSLGYSAPELLRSGKKATAASDVYSLAATTLFALTGADPGIDDLVRDPLGLLSRSDCPASVKPVLARGLAWHPRDRFPTMDEFAGALRRAMASIEPTAPPAQAQRELLLDQILSWTDDEVEQVVRLLPQEMKSQLHPARRPIRRRVDLASMTDIGRNSFTEPFLEEIATRLDRPAPPPSAQERGRPGNAELDWESSFEQLACASEDEFASVVARVALRAGSAIGLIQAELSANNQWEAARDIMRVGETRAQVARALAAILGALSGAGGVGAPPTPCASARYALVHGKVLLALDKMEAASGLEGDALTSLFRTMLEQSRYSDAIDSMDRLSDHFFRLRAPVPLALLGRIHTLLVDTMPRATTLHESSPPALRATRVAFYRDLCRISPEQFEAVIRQCSHPGALSSRDEPRARRAMALVRFDERWGMGADSKKLVEDLIGVSKAPEPSPGVRFVLPLREDSKEDLYARLIDMPRVLTEEVLFAFGVDESRGSPDETIRFLLGSAELGAVKSYVTALLAHFVGIEWAIPKPLEPRTRTSNELLSRLFAAGNGRLLELRRALRAPGEYTCSELTTPEVLAVDLAEWLNWRTDGVALAEAWVTRGASAADPPHEDGAPD